ncbi:MAG: Nif11 domain/cupin domain-containing protein [Synechococcaceae cyanobacterium]|nr:Nif11 domain/cupin domain-containing protein [Synechococcaceae cyanobacterium]
MAEADLQQFLAKVAALNAFVALSEADPDLRRALCECSSHHDVVALARAHGLEIGRRWGEPSPPPVGPEASGASLLASPCPAEGEESTTVLLQTPQLRLERIHSCRASSPAGFWYDQEEWEWVCLLQGSARLAFADESRERELNRGDGLLIAPHRRHRLLATDPAPGTIWLALWWSDGPG